MFKGVCGWIVGNDINGRPYSAGWGTGGHRQFPHQQCSAPKNRHRNITAMKWNLLLFFPQRLKWMTLKIMRRYWTLMVSERSRH